MLNRLKQIIIRERFKKKFKKKLGYSLDIKSPKTYCEKIQWLKFNHNAMDKNIITRADKYAVRDFIRSKGLGEYLIPLYGNWDSPEEINWQSLPKQFVLKLNNGSGPRYRWHVKDNSSFDKKRFIMDVRKLMKKKYGEYGGEFHYGKIPPKIIAEAYLREDKEAIKDYKFYCFHGKIDFFSVEEGKVEGIAVRDYYDLRWEKSSVKFFDDLPTPKQKFVKPDNFETMVYLAETLSEGFPHVRVDLYNVAGKVYFGELTYTPENGLTRWNPPSLDLKYGKLMNIYNISH